jgi:hypothetical protein
MRRPRPRNKGGTRSREKKENRIIVIVNDDVCPEAPNVPETAMERSILYVPCKNEKRMRMLRANHVRLVSWKAFYIEHAVRYRLALVEPVSQGRRRVSRQGPIAYPIGRRMIQQKNKRQYS